MTIRIGIAGISGRMGLLLAEAAAQSGELAGGTSRSGGSPEGAARFADIAALAQVSDVVIDFTHASQVAPHAAALAAAGTPWVLGTTGFDESGVAAIAQAAERIAVLAAPNFCTGVNLLLLLAERLGAALPGERYDAEILEMHHRQKLDAPSGTALALGEAVAAGRGVALAEVAVRGRDGHSAPRADGEIGFASLRGGQITGSHSLLFTAGDEQIVLTHHAFDRRVFATGALRAARWLAGRPPGRYTMRDVLGL
ncbi:MAG: 4-hydroxy-tetrahydrodipicolinate reductase [Acidocella sp. 20-61-6]|nr:MAG: 4-hydroxy-tetrahydrodipicolinate reductase [Acidocella sp. 20-61-6]